MLRRLAIALIVPSIVGLLVYTVLLNPAEPSRASQDPLVVNKTTGCEIKAEIVNNQVAITLKNNHAKTVTAFAIGFGNNHRITEDFAYSEVHLGIAPGEVFQERYPQPPLTGSVPTLYLLTALLENGSHDGNFLIAQKIRDERLGEKVQVHRTLRILENQKTLGKDPKALKDEVDAALSKAEPETLATLNELARTTPKQLSDDVKRGLQVGREKMLRRLAALEQFPSESRERELMELKARFSALLTRL
jgi:hypothetical protein